MYLTEEVNKVLLHPVQIVLHLKKKYYDSKVIRKLLASLHLVRQYCQAILISPFPLIVPDDEHCVDLTELIRVLNDSE